MFSASAEWYDHFYRDKPYGIEAEHVAEIIIEANPAARRLLDVACGTGRHLEHLAARFDCEGLDREQGLLDVAARRLPGLTLTRADMTTFDLGRRFDAVTCLFSAVGYLLTADRLRQAVAVMAGHLEPGGVLVVEPWILPDEWSEPGMTMASTAEDGIRLLIRVSSSSRQGNVSVLQMHYVVAEPGRIETADETHHLGLFIKDEYLGAFTAAGLLTRWDDVGLMGRGLVIGVRPR